jgi:hypothetical protein
MTPRHWPNIRLSGRLDEAISSQLISIISEVEEYLSMILHSAGEIDGISKIPYVRPVESFVLQDFNGDFLRNNQILYFLSINE